MVKATTCPTNTVRKNSASTIHWFTFDTTTLSTMTFSIIIRDIRIICLRHFSTNRERRISCIYITTARRTSISIAISRRIATSRRVIKTIKDSINDGTKCSTNFICYCIESCTNTGINDSGYINTTASRSCRTINIRISTCNNSKFSLLKNTLYREQFPLVQDHQQ